MPHKFRRSELYGLVWSEPMKTLAARYKISDVGLSKACRRYAVPTPERGYWAKLRAGKRVQKRPLPPRGPGMSDEITIGAGHRWWQYRSPSNQEILQSTPSPPVFEREIEEVIAEIRTGVGRVTVPKTMPRPHRLIAKLLEADEERRQRTATERYVFSWDEPQFDSPFEKRRLRLLNAIFTALERQGAKPWVRGREARVLGVHVNEQNVSFSVDDANAKQVDYHSDYQRPKNASGRMKVIIKWWRSKDHGEEVWEDTKVEPVEKAVTDIVVQLIVAAERQHRQGAHQHYEWLLERKARLIEEARRAREEAERKERERQVQLEREQIDRLLADATALRQAQDIRAYVRAVNELCAVNGSPLAADDLRTWKEWALAQADRIDPVVSGKFIDSMKDPMTGGEPEP